MRLLLLFTFFVFLVSGCAKPAQEPIAFAPPPLTMHNDPRTGTEKTPYRSIAPTIQCDGCEF